MQKQANPLRLLGKLPAAGKALSSGLGKLPSLGRAAPAVATKIKPVASAVATKIKPVASAVGKATQQAASKVKPAVATATRSVSNTPAGSPVGLRGIGRALFNPRYPGLDRAVGQPTTGLLRPLNQGWWGRLIPVGINRTIRVSRPLDRTRQSVANAARLSNKLVPGATLGAGAVVGANYSLNSLPTSVADRIASQARLPQRQRQELIDSFTGTNALRMLPSMLHPTDPVAKELRDWAASQLRRDIRYNVNNPSTEVRVSDKFRSLSPFGLATIWGKNQLGGEGPSPVDLREANRLKAERIAGKLLADPTIPGKSPVVRQLHRQLSPDLRSRLGMKPTVEGTVAPVESALTQAGKQMEAQGIKPEDFGAAAASAAHGGPSPDLAREKELNALAFARRGFDSGLSPDDYFSQLDASAAELAELHPSYWHEAEKKHLWRPRPPVVDLYRSRTRGTGHPSFETITVQRPRRELVGIMANQMYNDPRSGLRRLTAEQRQRLQQLLPQNR